MALQLDKAADGHTLAFIAGWMTIMVCFFRRLEQICHVFFAFMRSNRLMFLTGIAPLFIRAHLCAAPLAWFPGPALNDPISGASTTAISGGTTLLSARDYYYSPYSYPP